jgi:hypothetical protein
VPAGEAGEACRSEVRGPDVRTAICRASDRRITFTSPQLLEEDIVNQGSGMLWRSVSAKNMEPQITQMNANEARIDASFLCHSGSASEAPDLFAFICVHLRLKFFFVTSPHRPECLATKSGNTGPRPPAFAGACFVGACFAGMRSWARLPYS